jgi:hypothetical protein
MDSQATQTCEPEYVLWQYVGPESVFFYPSGSVQEHLVVEHGIPSLHSTGRAVTTTTVTIASSSACRLARWAICSPPAMPTSRPHDLGAHLAHVHRTAAAT